MKGKLQLIVTLLLALVISGGAFAAAYLTAGGTIGITEPTEDIATYNATATQPDWASILTAGESTEIIRPDADGDETNIANPGGDHYDEVDEVTADGDSTVVYTGSASWEEDLYSTANHTEGSSDINYVKVYIVCRSTATPTQTNAYVHIKTNGSEYNGTQETTATSYGTFSYQWDDNPQTGNPWTWSEIDALQIGVGLREPTGGEFTGCTQVYAEISYATPLVIGEVPTGDLFDVTPNPNYSGDLRVGVYLANTGNLTKAYQYLNMKLYLEGSAEAEETPNYRLLTLQNGQTELTFEELAGVSGNWTQTSQADFEGGTLNQVDTTTSPGDVILDTFADNVTDPFDDQSKIATSANITVAGGQVRLTAGGASGSETFRPNAAGDDTNISYEYPAWYDASWSRRIPVSINNSGSTLTNYQIRVDVTYDSDMQADFDDIRFTDTDGATLLSYWRETYTSSSSATFWVNVPSVPAGTKEIYMYYGNATVGSTSDGDATFEFFDDFEDGDISDWSTYGSGAVQIANDGGNYVLLKTSNNDPNGGYSLFNNGALSDYEAVFLTKRINETGGSQNRYGIEDGSFNGYGPRMADFNSLPSAFAIESRTSGTGSDLTSKNTSAYEWDTWMTVKFRKYGSTLEFELYDSSGSLAESINATDSSYNSFDRFVVHGGYEFYTDDVWIRKYVSTEPTTSLGTEESQGGHWDKVDEVTADDFSTYVYTNSTSYQRDLYNIPDHSTGSGAIDSVTAYFRFARTSSVGDVGIWQDTNNTHTIGNQGVWTDVPFNSQVKTSASFDHTSDTTTDLKADGWYLIMYEIRSTSTSGTRHGILARVTLEGSPVEGSEGFGYSRDDSNDEAYTAGACMVNASLNDTVVVQWQPYGVSGSDVLSNAKTSLMIVRLPDSADVAYLKYTDNSDSTAYGGTTWAGNEVPWEDQVYETDTSVMQKSAANDYTFTLKKVARYLVKYDVTFTSTSGTRTQRIARATLAGSALPQSYAYCYMRNDTTTPNTLHALFIVDNTLANQDLIIQAQRGAADQDGSVSRTISASSIEIMELPSGAETVITHDDVGGQDVGGTQTLNWAKIEDQRDSAAFTIPANTTIEAEQADDYLFLGNGFIEDTDKTSGTRLTFAGDWFIGGVENNIGGHGNYKRGDQGGADTWQASLNAHAILSLSADEQVTFRTALEGDGGGANDNTVADQCGFSALRIGSLITGTVYARAAVKTGGSVYNGSEESVASDTFVTESYQWTTNPDTGYAWTWSEVDALQVGVELRAGGPASNAVCTQVYVVVDHTAYDTLGTLTSVNLLSGETVASIDRFYYDVPALPSGTGLRVQFSQDSSNWYNSAGTPGGWDTLSAGTNSIDLSGLSWSGTNFYYHMEFTSDGSDTPVLEEISVVFATYYSSGDLTSSAFDTGDDLNWDWLTIYFTIAEPATTDIQFQLRSAATEGGLSSATWYGPTGTGDYYTTSGTTINSVHDGDRWIQYKAYFSGPGNSTPTLSDITINYTAGATTYTLSVIGGSYALVSANTSDWSEGWTVTPELYLEITQR